MKPILVFQTDFTYQEAAVSAMMGVVKCVDPSLEIAHASHEIGKYDVYSASYRLYQPFIYWPEGTIFVSVVDPGVGTDRKACIALASNGSYIVTPDNGTLTHIKHYLGIKEVREIDLKKHQLRKHGEVNIFHGRDVFAYTAAKLASAVISFEEVGPEYPLESIVTFPLKEASVSEICIEGSVDIFDPNFGNLWSNIDIQTFHDFVSDTKCNFRVVVGEAVFEAVPFVRAFGDVAKGNHLLYNNEIGKLSFALNQESLYEKVPVQPGTPFIVYKERQDEKDCSAK